MVAAPAPTSVPKAVERFISGNVTARPEMARGPTPWPMKMLSTMLYSDAAVCAMMAGKAYCLSSMPIFSVPSSKGIDALFSDILFLRLCYNFDLKDERSISRYA